jgi:hypothetical protein
MRITVARGTWITGVLTACGSLPQMRRFLKIVFCNGFRNDLSHLCNPRICGKAADSGV